MGVRRHLSYANVTATVALFVALGGGAYAVNEVNSREIANDSVRSVDLKNRRAVKGIDVKGNRLTGRQISERTLDARKFARMAGEEALDCNPSSTTAFTTCAAATLRLRRPSRLLVIATGGQESVGGPARAICEVRIDGDPQPLPAQPGEETSDNTSASATNGFARTLVSDGMLARGRHRVALACRELSGNARIDVPTIAAIAIGSG
jgi:hypothetical protein